MIDTAKKFREQNFPRALLLATTQELKRRIRLEVSQRTHRYQRLDPRLDRAILLCPEQKHWFALRKENRRLVAL